MDAFETANASVSTTYPVQCSDLRKNDHVCLNGRPCKILNISASETDEDGDAKVHIVGLDVLTQTRHETVCSSSQTMDVPVVDYIEYQVFDISDEGDLTLMHEDGTTKDDLKISDGAGDGMARLFQQGKTVNVTVLSAMGEEAIVDYKDADGNA